MKVILIVTICSILCLLSCKASRLSGKNVHDLLFVCYSNIAKHPNVILYHVLGPSNRFSDRDII